MSLQTLQTLQLLQVLRLASPALPVGAFAYSGGLESAIDEGLVDKSSARRWLDDALLLAQARWDAPVLWRFLHADDAAFAYWNTRYIASRETRELRLETLQLGGSLAKLMRDLDPTVTPPTPATPAPPTPELSFPAAWALASRAWQIAPDASLTGWLMAFTENQIAVLQKALPLGQVAAQRLLSEVLPTIESAAAIATSLPDESLSSSLPGLALLSARHETQYSRLFRS